MLDTPFERYIAIAVVLLLLSYIYIGYTMPIYERAKRFIGEWTPNFKLVYRD
jgi:hypothetical protein